MARLLRRARLVGPVAKLVSPWKPTQSVVLVVLESTRKWKRPTLRFLLSKRSFRIGMMMFVLGTALFVAMRVSMELPNDVLLPIEVIWISIGTAGQVIWVTSLNYRIRRSRKKARSNRRPDAAGQG
jgi:Tfp pilus assembly protein PilZ